MADSNSVPPKASDPMEALWQPWNEYWGRMLQQQAEAAQSLLAGTPPSVDPVEMRRRWLEALSRSMDAYLRSPVFLEGLRRSMDQWTTLKATSDTWQKEAVRQAGVPQVADLEGLASRLQANHEETLARLGELERRLAGLEAKRDSRRRA